MRTPLSESRATLLECETVFVRSLTSARDDTRFRFAGEIRYAA
jgi:hypothetical protein